MRIGLLYQGNDTYRIWGSSVTTLYLAESFAELGHSIWRASVTECKDWDTLTEQPSDLVISEGVPEWQVPDAVWRNSRCVVFWWLSDLFYNHEAVTSTRFHGIATNAEPEVAYLQSMGIAARKIELAAPANFSYAEPDPSYLAVCTYLGSYPHKTTAQHELILRPATEFDFSLWGPGWEKSPFQTWHRGMIPLTHIGRLYRSVHVVLALTEERQKRRGMINNRIYDALAASAVLISDPHPALAKHELGQFIHFAETPEEVRDIIATAHEDCNFLSMAREGQKAVLARHTYRDRVQDFLDFRLALQG